MSENVYTYLKFVRYKELENWSVQYSINSNLSFGRKFELKKIGSFLTRNKTAITVEDNVSYKRVTIKTNNGGCCLRDELSGKLIGTKQQFVISQGQFILSKIDARNGAMGVVPSECDKAIITGNFWTFDVNEKLIDSHYLSLVTTTRAFVDFAEKASNGTTNRHYLQEPLFLSQKIPLPTIDEQRTLVSAYNNKISQSEALEKQAAQVEQDIEDYLLSELGIKQKGYTQAEPTATVASEPQVGYVVSNRQLEDRADTYHWGDEIKKEYRFLKFVRFRDVIEWGYDRMVGGNNKLLHSTIYPNYKLGQLLDINPTTSFSNLDGSDEISFIPMECISDKYGEWKEKRICKVSLSKGYTKFSDGDLIWARITPCMQNGKSAIVYGLENGYGCGSTEFHVIRNHNENLNLHYIHLLLRLPAVLRDAMKSFTGSAGQQRVPKSYLEQLSVPVPSLNIQSTIVEHINEQKEQIKQLRLQAENLRKEALVEFEKEIFD
ncbi:MAG: restriction endonuclease subunit S [Paludibacteraceae bacterium]|nr:restriction endonuclease subunit S [Paludibacteraceae bacterium]